MSWLCLFMMKYMAFGKRHHKNILKAIIKYFFDDGKLRVIYQIFYVCLLFIGSTDENL